MAREEEASELARGHSECNCRRRPGLCAGLWSTRQTAERVEAEHEQEDRRGSAPKACASRRQSVKARRRRRAWEEEEEAAKGENLVNRNRRN